MRVEELCGMGSSEKPTVGMKCTLHLYSDSHACQIVKVSPSGKTIWFRRNVVTVDPKSDAGAGHQDWIIHDNEFVKVAYDYKNHKSYRKPTLTDSPDNYSYYKATLRKDGKWRTSGSDTYVALGQWYEYYDWTF